MMSPPAIRFRCVTLRRSGATEIRIVHAASPEAARERLIANGLEPVEIEAVGPSLADDLHRRIRAAVRGSARWPDLRRAAAGLPGYLLPAALIGATIPFTVAAGAWGLTLLARHQTARLAQDAAPAIAAARAGSLVDQARSVAAPVMARPGLSVILARLAAIIPADAGLASVARDPSGGLVLQIDTPDPDGLRPILAGDPLFAALRETGQSPTDEGTIRVTLTARPR